MADGLPQGAKFQNLQKFGGLNTQASRFAIADEEFSWIENFMPIGEGNMRAVPGPSAALYTATGSLKIIYFFPFNIASTYYHFVVLSDGSAIAVAVSGGAVTNLWASGTFTTTSLPSATQYGNKYLLVIDPNNGYYIWDGTSTYFGQGSQSSPTASLGPVITITAGGSGYTSAPTISFSGGSGSGATATAKIVNGVVVSASFTDSGTGYKASDSAPTVSFSGGGGSGATATVVIMPIGLKGTDIQVYTGYVWLLNGASIQNSAPSDPVDWSSAKGGDSFTASDSNLRVNYTALQQSSGFLYPLADSSIDVINNVQTSSGGATSFNNYNVDPQVGTIWRDASTVFGRTIMLANASGVYRVLGGAAQKVSAALDGIFPSLKTDFSPTSGSVYLFGVKLFAILLFITDPFNTVRPVLFLWDGKKWFSASQGDVDMSFIATLYFEGEEQLWATNGTKLYQCFTTASDTLEKTLQSKFWAGSNFIITKETQRLAVELTNNAEMVVQLTFNMQNPLQSFVYDFQTGTDLIFIGLNGVPIQFQDVSDVNLNFISVGFSQLWQNVSWSGKSIGFTMTTTAEDFTINAINIMYIETTAY